MDADLLGLDLHSTQAEKQLTSIEQLSLNEKLIINRTTWMDSELVELGGTEPTADATPKSPNTPGSRVTRLSSVEQQLVRLGLDTSKTTLASAPLTEMSISARLVYDRLPDMSFMLSDILTDNPIH